MSDLLHVDTDDCHNESDGTKSAPRSPCSSPYLRKLSSVSPRTLKGIDPKFNLTPDLQQNGAAGTYAHASVCSVQSSSSSSYDSGYLTTPGERGTQFEFQPRKPSMETESNADDIDFFLQVVGVFRDYVSDQINVLETQFKDNKDNLEILQSQLKTNETEASQNETQLMRDFSHLLSILHQKQSELHRIIKKQSADVSGRIRDQSDLCRRNMKMVAGILNFAKRLRNESGESMRENAVREFKQRLLSANDLPSADVKIKCDSALRVNVDAISKMFQTICFEPMEQNVEGQKTELQTNGAPQSKTCSNCSFHIPLILGVQNTSDVTKTTLKVRWSCCSNCESEFNLKWSYKLKEDTVEKLQEGISATSFIIKDLPSNCDITVNVCHTKDTSWSPCAIFKTEQSPANFSFDVNTAHIKLKLSPDSKSVYYPGDEYNNASPKSPSRFTFALNVLGNISFYSGRHYWEIEVNRNGWALGVAYRGVARNSWLGSNDSSWILHYNPCKFEYKVRHAGEATDVTPKLNTSFSFMRRVGVFLNYDAGIIKFLDCTRRTVMYTYVVKSFEQPVCAAANPFYHGGYLTLVSGLDIPNYIHDV